MKAKALQANIASAVSKVLGRPSKDAASQGRVAHAPLYNEWLITAGETDNLTAAHLRNLYAEFCEYTDTDPLPDAQFFRGLKASGIERFREGGGQRRWLYRVIFPKLREVQAAPPDAA